MKNIAQYNDKGQPHGYWVKYYSNGKFHFKGKFINGKQSGYFEFYTLDGNANFKEYHIL